MAAKGSILTTERLTLRPHTRDDFADSWAMWAEPAVVRHIGGTPSTREEAWSRLLRYVGHWHVQGFGYWCLRETQSGRFVGEAGFADFKRDMVPSIAGMPEAGWALASWAHGQGYAVEALRCILAWGDANLAAARTVCLIDPANAPSIRLAGKLGYSEFARGRYKEKDSVLYERPAGM